VRAFPSWIAGMNRRLADAEYLLVSARDDRAPWPGPGRLRTEDVDGLLTAAAGGDHDAFDLVVRQLSGPIYVLVRAVVRDPAQAEEVTQEVLFEMWRSAIRFDPAKGSAAARALTIARHRAIDRVRSVEASSARDQRNVAVAVSWDQVSEAVEETLARERLRDLCRSKIVFWL
jgi:RNA polymerase sigma-70 factor (ECF subfamily)